MNRFLALILLAPLSLVSACHEHAGVGREPDEYVGCATDENWATFDDVDDLVSDIDAPVYMPNIASPSLPNTPVELAWNPKPGQVPADGNGDVSATCEQWNTGFAPLHLAPVSGTVYDLQLATGGAIVHRVITTLTRWQASEALWTSLRGKSVTMTLRRMVILNNDRKEGPFVSTTPATLMIAP